MSQKKKPRRKILSVEEGVERAYAQCMYSQAFAALTGFDKFKFVRQCEISRDRENERNKRWNIS